MASPRSSPRTRALHAAATVVLALVAAACSKGSTAEPARGQAPPVPGDAAADADLSRLSGKPLYVALCAPCHGVDGKGYAADRAPSLVNPRFLESASDEFLRRSIATGRPGTSMAAYSKQAGGPLDNTGIDRLVQYLREQGPPIQPLPAPTGGDVSVGAAVYAKQCVSCHGDTMTRGEAPSLANPAFQAQASDGFIRYALVHGRPGTKMEAFAGKLTDAEIDSTVLYVRALGNGGDAAVKPLPAPTGKEPLVINPKGKHPSFELRATRCPPGTEATCKPDARFVSVAQVAKAMAAKQRMIIIDARPPSDWRRVHITGAVSIPYHDMKRLDEVPRDGTWAIAYCACPHHLSGIVVDELRKRGHEHAVVLDEGINDWHRLGHPVVAAEGVTKPLPEPPLPPRRSGAGSAAPPRTIR